MLSDSKKSACSHGRPGFDLDSWVDPWRNLATMQYSCFGESMNKSRGHTESYTTGD